METGDDSRRKAHRGLQHVNLGRRPTSNNIQRTSLVMAPGRQGLQKTSNLVAKLEENFGINVLDYQN